MTDRRLFNAYISSSEVVRNRQSGVKEPPRLGAPAAVKITEEIITGVIGNGLYTVLGTNIPSSGNAQFVVGDAVPVFWQNEKPFLILGHNVRRAQFTEPAVPSPGPVIEQLFLLPTLENNNTVNLDKADVWFRNRDLIAPLKIHKQVTLPSFEFDGEIDADVKWGLGGDRFMVSDDVKIHVFKLSRDRDRAVPKGQSAPAARLERTIKFSEIPGNAGTLAITFPPVDLAFAGGDVVGGTVVRHFHDSSTTFVDVPSLFVQLNLSGPSPSSLFVLKGTFSGDLSSLSLEWVTPDQLPPGGLPTIPGGTSSSDRVFSFGTVSITFAHIELILDDRGEVFINYILSASGKRYYSVATSSGSPSFSSGAQIQVSWDNASSFKVGSAVANASQGQVIDFIPLPGPFTFPSPDLGSTTVQPVGTMRVALLVPASNTERASGVPMTAKLADVQEGVASKTFIFGGVISVSWGFSITRTVTVMTIRGSATIFSEPGNFVSLFPFSSLLGLLGVNLHRAVSRNFFSDVITMFDLERGTQKDIFTSLTPWTSNRLTVLRPDLIYASSEGSRFSVRAFNRRTGEILLNNTFPTFPLSNEADDKAAHRKWQDLVLKNVDGLKNLPTKIKEFVDTADELHFSDQVVNDPRVLTSLGRFQKD